LVATFVDAGVLIAAACGLPEIAERAFRVLDDPERTLVSSEIVRLEVLPKPSFQKLQDQVLFYEEFFSAVQVVPGSARLVKKAFREALQAGLSACDALHVAAARQSKCQELVTTEGPTRPLFRVQGIKVISLR
jgi:predicted nucleic acid-binding protein